MSKAFEMVLNVMRKIRFPKINLAKTGSYVILKYRTLKWSKMDVLKLKKHNQRKEIDFELKFLASLTTKQRFEMMRRKTEEILNLLKRHGHRKTSQIIKRK